MFFVATPIVSLLTDVAVAAITAIAGPITMWWVKRMYKAKEEDRAKKRTIEREMSLNIRIENELEKIREKYDADRVWIARFHNGSHYISGAERLSSMRRISITHESTKEGVSSEKSEIQGLLVSRIPRFIKDLTRSRYVCSDKKDYSTMFRLLLENRGAKSVFAFPMESFDDKITGFVAMDFPEDTPDCLKSNIVETKARIARLVGFIFYEVEVGYAEQSKFNK